jgi:probable F420-dependent oxidoreductase
MTEAGASLPCPDADRSVHRDGRLPRFGVFLPAYVLPGAPPPSGHSLTDYARQAEAVGFSSVWVFDHLFDAPPSYRAVFLEPVTTLALVISVTQRVRLGTGILVLPLRDPVVTAKAFANLDLMSDGRLVFGVGVGWDEREFRACQVPKSERGRRMDEALEIIKGLWTEEVFSYRGRIFTVPEVRLVPRPVQRPHPPIWLAGGTVPAGTSRHITSSPGYTYEASIRRAGRLGNGLMTAYRSAPGTDTTELVRTRGLLEAEARAAGRDPTSLTLAHHDHVHIDLDPTTARLREVLGRFSYNRLEDSASIYLMGHPEELIPQFQARIDAGIDELTFNLMTPDPRQLDLFATRIQPHLRPRCS